jgi:phytoene desaturase
MMERPHVGVIGSGLAGLAAACTLAARGYQVTVFEKCSWLGGKAAVLSEHGFRFDMGPTILTVPSVLNRVFAEAGRSMDAYLDLVRLDPQWRCFFTDGAVIDLVENVEAMSASLDQFAPRTGSGEGYRQFQQLSQRLHRISNTHFFWKSIGSILEMIDLKFGFSLALLGDVLSMRMGRSVAGTVRKFNPDPRVAQMLDHFTQYVGSSPESSPAVLCAIAHMQTQEGIWYPRGGTRAVPEALVRLGEELGVEYRTNTGIREILVDEATQRIRGVETEDGEQIQLSAVVSNADSVRTHRELLAETAPQVARRFERRRGYEPACSGVVLYLGLNKAYDHLLHHDFVFSRDPHEEFEYIYRKGEPAPDPTCYLASTARTDPDSAPPGGDALYVLAHTPYLRPHHDWKRMLPEYRHVIIEKLKSTGKMPDLESRIVFEAALTPQDIHERYRVLNGAIYGLASHGKLMGAFKPANRSPDLKGLYLAGGAVHPGPGMPMVLMSGWIAADTLDQDFDGPKTARQDKTHASIMAKKKLHISRPNGAATSNGRGGAPTH